MAPRDWIQAIFSHKKFPLFGPFFCFRIFLSIWGISRVGGDSVNRKLEPRRRAEKETFPLIYRFSFEESFLFPSFFLFPTVLRSRCVPDSNFQIFEHAIFSQFPSSLPEIVGEVPLLSLDGSEKIKNRSPWAEEAIVRRMSEWYEYFLTFVTVLNFGGLKRLHCLIKRAKQRPCCELISD